MIRKLKGEKSHLICFLGDELHTWEGEGGPENIAVQVMNQCASQNGC